jgi:DNA-binding IclR family transcriptional regulator/sugar lactone lactonase YvrE
MTTKAGDGSATVEKALDVMDAVGASRRGLTQLELAERLCLPKTTMYRLLGTLVARGMLRRDPQRRVYCLGFRCFEYAREAYAMPDLAASASAELRMLRDLSGETTYLATLDGLDVLSLDRCDGAHSRRSAAVLGQRKPLHCTSQGKAILSAMAPAQRDAIIRDISLSALTPRTITDRRRLQAELKVTAARGYAIDDEEIVVGVRCCGAPIVDAAGQVRGAISIAGPAFRLTMARVELLGPEVAQAARRIGAQLWSQRTGGEGEGEVHVVEGDRAFHGAFPCWTPAQHCLRWADTLAPALHVLHDQGNPTDAVNASFAALDSPILAMLRESEATLLLHESGWVRVRDDGCRETVDDLPGPGLRAVTAGPDGRLWACMPDGERWFVGPLESGGGMGNGWYLPAPATALAWQADRGQLFAAMPDTGEILSLRAGQATPRRLVTIPKGSGRISGLALDQEGGVWTALCDGWSAMRISEDGMIERVVGLPVPCPTDVAFGGADCSQLYVVSARHSLSMDAMLAAPLSGRLFRVDTGLKGQATLERRNV